MFSLIVWFHLFHHRQVPPPMMTTQPVTCVGYYRERGFPERQALKACR